MDLPFCPDAIMFCDGPDLEEESDGFVDILKAQVCVNKSINRLIFKRDVEVIYCDPALPYLIDTKTPRHLIRPVYWVPKMGWESKTPTLTDYPELVHFGFTMFTAMHYLVCMGKKNIYAPGLNLKSHQNRSYARESIIDGSEVFSQIRHRWDTMMKPFLHDNGVRLFSSSLREG